MASKKGAAKKTAKKGVARRGRAPQMSEAEILAWFAKQAKGFLAQSKTAALKAFRAAHSCEQNRFLQLYRAAQAKAYPGGVPKPERKTKAAPRPKAKAKKSK